MDALEQMGSLKRVRGMMTIDLSIKESIVADPAEEE